LLATALVLYAATLAAFVILDAAWLALVAVDLFRGQLGAVLRPEPDLIAGAAFYLVYAGGLAALAGHPARGPAGAAARGAILGLSAYATFDLTSLAIVAGWTPGLALLDMAWGTAASAAAAACGRAAATRAARHRARA